MAKRPLLDATSRPDSPYSSFTRGYRQSENIIDNREKNVALRPSQTPRNSLTPIADAFNPRGTGASPRTRGSGYDEGTPDDYNSSDIGAMVSKSTPGSGFPSVTTDQQAAQYAPVMEDYIKRSK